MKFRHLIILFSIIGLISGCKQSNTTDPGETSLNMTMLGKINFPSGFAYGVCAAYINNTNCAFVAAGNAGLQVVNYNSFANLNIISNYNTSGESFDVSVNKINNINFAFLSDNYGGFVVVNVNDPYHIFLDTNITLLNDKVLTSFVDTSNNTAYVGTYTGRIYIFDISQLPNPVNLVAIYHTVSPILGINVANGLAYVSEGEWGLEIVNVSNPAVPAYIGSFNTPGISYRTAVNNMYAYIADGNAGITIIDISNPFNLKYIMSYKTNDDCLGIFYTPTYLYSAEGTNGCASYGIVDQKNPTQYAYYKTLGYSTNIFYSNGLLLLADGPNGLIILQ
jgi:hypothetical protein